MATGSVDQDRPQTGAEAGFDIVLRTVTDEQNLGSGQADCRHCGVKDLAIGFAIAGLTRERDCIEKASDTEAVHYRIDAAIEVRNHAKFKPAVLQFLEDFESFGKKDPALCVSKFLINFIEELIEVLDHSDVVENTMHNVLPPAFLIVDRERSVAPEMAKKCLLNHLGRSVGAVLARDTSIDFKIGRAH